MAKIKKSSSIIFDALTLEGGLIAPAMLERIAARDAGEQTETDYGIPKGLTLRDEMARYFRIGQALYEEFRKSETPTTATTVNFIEKLLRDVFAFQDIKKIGTRILEEHTYAVTLEALDGRVPVVIVPPSDALDRASDHLPSDGRKRSAATAIQDWLNADEESLWGFCSNGDRLRLVRDNASLTRPAYLEADLQQIFENDNFADFTALWLLLNASRFGLKGSPVSDCALERWKESGSKEGVAARDRLRDGVEQALLALGNGFLEHPRNRELREQIEKGELPLQDFFTQLLRLVYRLIFMLAAEDRDLLHAPNATVAARKLYSTGYSLNHIRKQSVRRAAWDRHYDKWEGLLIVFAALAKGEPLLGLPALGGLFGNDATKNLNEACLSNKSLMEAVYRLAWLKEDHRLTPVNWRDMETEELGSVYESLLELTPRLNGDGWRFFFAEGAETKGNARKTTGSYYTPDSLVQALLDSALDPVLDRVERESEDPEKGLLSITTIDPACGSGHFLLAAARRIASRVARLRAGGVASAEDYRHALRDVVRNCVYGVDRNPMAVELTKVALWIETVEPGKPLGFLDANIRCGDALLGVFDLETLREGIPDAAYKPLTGDDKDTAKYYAKRNKDEKAGQGELGLLEGKSQLPPPPPMAKTTKTLRSLPEDSVKEIAEKKQKFEASLSDPTRWKWRVAADMYVAAFLAPKVGGEPPSRGAAMIPTTAHVWEQLSNGQSYGPLVGKAQGLAGDAHAFHWPLEFPDIMERGGFDVILGNPPWERVKLQEKEFFASRDPEIADAPTAAARRKLIQKLGEANQGTRERLLFEEFEEAKRLAEAASLFTREGGRYPLTGRGDVNTYALFAEHFKNSINVNGRSGVIVPTGIATDASTAPFFSALIDGKQLVSLIDFENTEGIFPSVASLQRFCLLTIGHNVKQTSFSFLLKNPLQLEEQERRFILAPEQIARINPNTKTASIFRTRKDAELVAKIYEHQPVLLNKSEKIENNPWNISFMRMFDMSNDSASFITADQIDNPEDYLPLYEAKMMSIYDHRFGSYPPGHIEDTRALPRPSLEEKQNLDYEINPRFWVHSSEVRNQVQTKWDKDWLLCYRSMSNHSNLRRFISSVIPLSAVGNSLAVVLPSDIESNLVAALAANFSALVFDFVARNKLSGTNLNFFFVEQFPVLPPSTYSEDDLNFIVPRVLELTYTSHAMEPFASDLGYDGPPFKWDEEHRALLRAELDAWYANAYGLTRDELRYILDPADVMGPDYPSETFRVLKEREIKECGEYRTQRLVLEAWDRMYGEETQVAVQQIAANALATPPNVQPQNIAMFAIMDVMQAMGQNVPEQKARLAALLARKPALALPFMNDTQRAEWQRVIGQEAQPLPDNVVSITDFQNNQGADHAWGEALRQLQGSGALIMQNGLWSVSDRLGASGESWMEDRVRKIIEIVDNIDDLQTAYNNTIVLFLREVHNGTARRAVS
ncbi:MAG: N-6 DNA methylase [Alphaproteobacteria bacterium]|nr:N-6 DNA methylase [Alphaproteobacteria bacterium]